MKTAFLFPGQGAQYVGMGKDFYDQFPVAKKVFDEADSILQENLSQIIFEGPLEKLTETRYAQLAIFVTSVAIYRVIQEKMPDLTPDVCAGLSLGEYTALFVSNRLSFKETLLLIQKRAEFMHAACEDHPGTMAAVLGLSIEQMQSAIKGQKGVWIANFNAPGQTVISGTKEGVERAKEILKERGAKRVLPLTVHGAFHSELMLPAQEKLAPFIQDANIYPSEVAFVMNVSGKFVEKVEEIRSNLISQVSQSVCWEQGIEAMKKENVTRFIEIGCGKTLAGLNKKMGIMDTISVEKISDLELLHAHT